MRVLLLEDDVDMAQQVSSALSEARYAVDVAYDGEEGHFLGENEPYDAIILDLGLPRRSGLDALEQWRKKGHTFPVLILSARNTWREKVIGLHAGADDYLSKPFAMEELLARVEALIRRNAGHASTLFSCGPLQLDTSNGKFFLDSETLILTALEHRLLSYLIHHPERVISKTELAEHIYEYDTDRDSNTIEVLVNRVRNKIGAQHIHTHRGRGYRLTADVNTA